MEAEQKTTNEISYADDLGVMQFLRRSLLAGAYKFDARRTQVLPKSMLKHFRQNLNYVSTLACIGYGFGDLHINMVLREWLELSSDRQLEIVSPIVQDMPSFLLHLSPQVVITNSLATDYLDGNAGIVRSPWRSWKSVLPLFFVRLAKSKSQMVLPSFLAMTESELQKRSSQS